MFGFNFDYLTIVCVCLWGGMLWEEEGSHTFVPCESYFVISLGLHVKFGFLCALLFGYKFVWVLRRRIYGVAQEDKLCVNQI